MGGPQRTRWQFFQARSPQIPVGAPIQQPPLCIIEITHLAAAGFPLRGRWRELGSISMETRQPQPAGGRVRRSLKGTQCTGTR